MSREKVEVVEVGLRDGLPSVIPPIYTPAKITSAKLC